MITLDRRLHKIAKPWLDKMSTIDQSPHSERSMSTTKAKPAKPLWWATATVIAVSFFAMGWIGWPGLHWDSVYFTAPILNVANGLGWQFNPYSFGESDAILLYTRDHYFNSHDMLNVLIFG
jgi:hypothetical protein